MKKATPIITSLFVILLFSSAVVVTLSSAEAVKSHGTPNHKYGAATKNLVCGDRLCSDVEENRSGSASQQSRFSMGGVTQQSMDPCLPGFHGTDIKKTGKMEQSTMDGTSDQLTNHNANTLSINPDSNSNGGDGVRFGPGGPTLDPKTPLNEIPTVTPVPSSRGSIDQQSVNKQPISKKQLSVEDLKGIQANNKMNDVSKSIKESSSSTKNPDVPCDNGNVGTKPILPPSSEPVLISPPATGPQPMPYPNIAQGGTR